MTVTASDTTILKRARELHANGYDDIPYWMLMGKNWIEDMPAREALRRLLRAGDLVDAPYVACVMLPQNG